MRFFIKTGINISVFFTILLVTISISAQEKVSGLIINEVYLDKKQPAKNWIEIFNPTGNQLTLERLRISDFTTINVLPMNIKESGGINVEAGQYIVLCADKKHIKKKDINFFHVDALKYLSDGGFIAIRTKDLSEDYADAFRFGKPEFSSYIKGLLGDYVIQFSKSNKSYSREITGAENNLNISDFYESSPTPGYKNK